MGYNILLLGMYILCNDGIKVVSMSSTWYCITAVFSNYGWKGLTAKNRLWR
jgi:hypothetical protein